MGNPGCGTISSKNYCADRITGKQVVQTLKLGASGADVVKLQKRLLELGLNPGPADGKFGPKTEASLKQFQTNQKFLANGIAGKETLAALFPGEPLGSSLLSYRAIELILEFEVGGGRKNLAGRSIGNYDRHRLRSRLQHSRSFQPRLAEIRRY
ncbi:MAG: peptidoglycan-binding protein [Oscillatoriales cyanobacterium]|nr:MAG: peptidoglycan-binding protein [Oscillatoriales cyanobacterium]